VLADLPLAEKERFYEFLVANKVEFIADPTGESFQATIRVVPPEPATGRLTGRARQAAKQNMRRANSAGARAPLKSSNVGSNAPPSQDAGATLKAAQSVLRRRYTRFCNLLPVLMAPPKAHRRTAVIRFCEEVYDTRYEKDAQLIKINAQGDKVAKSAQGFPEYVYEFAAKRYGLKALVSNNCWGLVSSVELLRGQHAGIDCFGKFLEQYYDVTDLLFFLFMRSALVRVLEQAAKAASKSGVAPEAGSESKDKKEEADSLDIGEKKKSVQSKYVPQDIRMEPKQMVQVVKMAVDAKNESLRKKVIEDLDYAMAQQQGQVPGSKPSLEPDRLLAIATEAYHLSRDLKGDTPEVAPGSPQKEAGIADGAAPSESLPPEIRKEVRQVTSRLVASLSANGQKDVNPQDAYQWALQVTLRRHKVGDFLDKPADNVTSLDLNEMNEAAQSLAEQPESQALTGILETEDVLGLSPEEFEADLEGNVRLLLLNAIAELAGDAIAALPIPVDEGTADKLKQMLVGEFASTADIIMESIVSKDYKRWMETLCIQGNGSVQQKQQFEKLHMEFQQVLNSEITASVVQQICRAVVGADELYVMVRAKAEQMAKLGGFKARDDDDGDEGQDSGATGGAFSNQDAF